MPAGLQMHACQNAYDLQMAQLFRADVHQQVLALQIVAVDPLDRVLHRSREFTVSAAELLEQHVAKFRIGRVDPHRVHQFFYVVIHSSSLCWVVKTLDAVMPWVAAKLGIWKTTRRVKYVC